MMERKGRGVEGEGRGGGGGEEMRRAFACVLAD